MVKYVHIGYPKCFSTTLQRSFFDAHSEILHLGIGCGSNVDYIDEHVSAYMENYLVYARHFIWQEQAGEVKRHFETWFERAASEGYAAVGVSLEHLAFSFTTDNIDTVEKARRVHEVFGDDTKIVMVVRNQMDLLASLYRESIRTGNPGSYKEFIEFCVLLKDRNFVYDFRYDLVYALYSKLFGAENVLVLFMEELRDEAGILTQDEQGRSVLSQRLSRFLNVSETLEITGHFNAALSSVALAYKEQLNAMHGHDLGNAMYGRGVSFHRLNDYLQLAFPGRLTESFVYQDVRTKRELIKQTEKVPAKAAFSEQPDSWLLTYLEQFYAAGNQQLERQIDRKLPFQYVGTTVPV